MMSILFRLCLTICIALTSMSHAVMSHEHAGARVLVLCTGTGTQSVLISANSEELAQHVDCSDGMSAIERFGQPLVHPTLLMTSRPLWLSEQRTETNWPELNPARAPPSFEI